MENVKLPKLCLMRFANENRGERARRVTSSRLPEERHVQRNGVVRGEDLLQIRSV